MISKMMRISLILTALLVLNSSAVTQQSAETLPGGPFRTAGIVVSATTGSPLPQSRVTISQVKNPSNKWFAITSDEGRFEFAHLPAGKFSLAGARRGFIPGTYDQHEQFSTAIVTGAGVDTENLVLRLVPDAVLTGTATDDSGEPIRNAQVTLYRENHAAGVTRIVRARVATTDDRGSFEFAPLSAGNYFVSVSAKPWYATHPVVHPEEPSDGRSGVDPALDVAYATTYYGDVTDGDDATPIPIRGGDRGAIEIHLNAVPALHLVFHADDPEHGIRMPLLQKRVFDTVEQEQAHGVQQLSPGVFELSGVAPGRYSIRIPSGSGSDARYTQAMDVDLSKDRQELDVGSGQPQGGVKIAVQNRAELPQQLAIGLQNSARRTAGYQNVPPSGEVSFGRVDPGNYTVLAASPTKAFSVLRIWSQGSSASGHTLTVPAGSSVDVSVTLASGEVELEGFAKAAGRPAAGVMIVLIPKDVDHNRELFRRDQSDLDGSFQLHSVIPGSYTITAIENGWDLDWSQPGVIAVYAKHGQPLTVPADAHGTVRLPQPVEVQGR